MDAMDAITRLTDTAPTAAAAVWRTRTLIAASGLLGAVAASSCCILPLLLFSLGISGAWIGNLTRLAPYQPIFVAVTFICLGCGYWMVLARRRTPCAADATCSRPLPDRVLTIALLAATLLVAAAVAFDFLAPLILA
jgi:mercuric ion transport protein